MLLPLEVLNDLFDCSECGRPLVTGNKFVAIAREDLSPWEMYHRDCWEKSDALEGYIERRTGVVAPWGWGGWA